MPKRGETLPYKVRYEWSNGVKGVVSRRSQDEADMMAERIRGYGAAREDGSVTVTVTHEPRKAR